MLPFLAILLRSVVALDARHLVMIRPQALPLILLECVVMTPPQMLVMSVTPLALKKSVLLPGPRLELAVQPAPTTVVLILGRECVIRVVLNLLKSTPPGPLATLPIAGAAFPVLLIPTRLAVRNSKSVCLLPAMLPGTVTPVLLVTLVQLAIALEHKLSGEIQAKLTGAKLDLPPVPKLLRQVMRRNVPRLTLLPLKVMPGRMQLSNRMTLNLTFPVLKWSVILL